MSIAKIKDFFIKYETKIVLIVGFCLISAISYEFGVLQGQKWQQKPLVIEKGANTPQEGESAQNGAPSGPQGPSQTQEAKIGAAPANMANCAFVGSKNSDKFYVPSCSFAKRVKPENLVCFKSAQEATSQGRTESKCK